MPTEFDPLKAALNCLTNGMECRRNELCPYREKGEDEKELVCNLEDVLKAALARIESLETALLDPKRLLSDTLVLRSKFFLNNNHVGGDRARIAAQIAKADGVVVVPNYFDVMFVPKGTTVKIEDCIKEPELIKNADPDCL